MCDVLQVLVTSQQLISWFVTQTWSKVNSLADSDGLEDWTCSHSIITACSVCPSVYISCRMCYLDVVL